MEAHAQPRPAEAAPQIERFTFSIPEFCAAHGISLAFYYLLKKRGLAPDELSLSKRKIISVEAAARWRKERTVPAAAVAAS